MPSVQGTYLGGRPLLGLLLRARAGGTARQCVFLSHQCSCLSPPPPLSLKTHGEMSSGADYENKKNGIQSRSPDRKAFPPQEVGRPGERTQARRVPSEGRRGGRGVQGLAYLSPVWAGGGYISRETSASWTGGGPSSRQTRSSSCWEPACR